METAESRMLIPGVSVYTISTDTRVLCQEEAFRCLLPTFQFPERARHKNRRWRVSEGTGVPLFPQHRGILSKEGAETKLQSGAPGRWGLGVPVGMPVPPPCGHELGTHDAVSCLLSIPHLDAGGLISGR